MNNTNFFDSPDKLLAFEENIAELDIEQLKERFESLDPHDMPYMPGQYVYTLA